MNEYRDDSSQNVPERGAIFPAKGDTAVEKTTNKKMKVKITSAQNPYN